MRLRHGLLPFVLLVCCHAPARAGAANLGAVFPVFALLETAEAVKTAEVLKTLDDAKAAESVKAGASAPPREAVRPAPLALRGQSGRYREAYRDTYNVLSREGGCSAFFGGGPFAIEVLNDLSAELKTRNLRDRAVGMIMAGETRNVIKASTGQAYRLFAEAALNSDGPFFRGADALMGRGAVRVGSFEGNTRAARVLILLHELAHLIRRPDGRWLIPNDGKDNDLSERNTALVEAACGAELKNLGDEQ
ncbi:MAG TPA: hypothetical protein VF546_17875 [Pyrinomonadaceae bacterium]|jgi:hypothetical protein